MAELENLDSKVARPPQGEDKIDRWVAAIDNWVNKIDRGMGEGRAASGTDPADEEVGSLPDPASGPAV